MRIYSGKCKARSAAHLLNDQKLTFRSGAFIPLHQGGFLMSTGSSSKSLNPLAVRSSSTEFNKSRWAELEKGLKKTVDRRHYEVGAFRDDTSSLTEQILANYKTCTNDGHVSWMQQLAKESMQFLAQRRGIKLQVVRKETLYNQAIWELINRVFDHLQTYSFEFNHVMGWNELRTTSTRPALITEVLRYNKFREPLETSTCFRARLSTRFMSLVIRGQKDCIEFMFLPVEKVIGLSKAESCYEPVCKLDGKLSDGQVTWYMNNQELSIEQLEVTSIELFTELIARTKLASQTDQE